MSDTSTVTGLLPVVVVGGAIGILASVVGPYWLQRAKDKADQKRKRAEKFEEFVAAVHEHYHWIARYPVGIYGNEKSNTGTSPLTKIDTLVNLYFYDFKSPVALSEMDAHHEGWPERHQEMREALRCFAQQEGFI